MNEFGKVTMNLIAASLEKAAATGINKQVIIGNWDDIDRNESIIENGVLVSLDLKPGKKAYKFESIEKSTTGEAILAKGTYFDNYDHAVTIRAFSKKQEVKNFVNSLKSARVFVIVENKEIGPDGEVKYELYGWDNGIKLAELPYTTDFADGVVYSMKLASDENAKEGQLPLSVYAETLTDTENMIAGLVAE